MFVSAIEDSGGADPLGGIRFPSIIWGFSTGNTDTNRCITADDIFLSIFLSVRWVFDLCRSIRCRSMADYMKQREWDIVVH